MKYSEAIKKSFTVPWKISTCDSGEKCWCRIIIPDTPILYKERVDDDFDLEYIIVSSGLLHKDTAEYIVNLHNNTLK